MSNNVVHKKILQDLLISCLKSTYNVRDYCNDYYSYNNSIYNKAKELADNFVDNLEDNIKNYQQRQSEAKKEQEEKQKLFDKKTFNKFQQLVEKGIKNIPHRACGCPVSKKQLDYNFDGYEAIPNEFSGVWVVKNEDRWDKKLQNCIFDCVMFWRALDDTATIKEKYQGPGYYFYGKKICEFSWDFMHKKSKK